MPEGYHHLTYEERCQIYALMQSGLSQAAIARQLGVHRSTIKRELDRNTGARSYRFKQAQEKASQKRKTASCAPRKMKPDLVKLIEEKLTQEQWSPDQISGWLMKNGAASISHERIYQHVWEDKKNGGTLYVQLRHRGKKYNKRKGKTSGRGLIPNRVDIDQRPAIVAEKSRIGDWEADTIIGAGHKGIIMSHVDRKSKYTKLAKLPDKSADPSCGRADASFCRSPIASKRSLTTTEKSSPPTPKLSPHWVPNPTLRSLITRGNAASTNTQTASSGSTSQKAQTSLPCRTPTSKGSRTNSTPAPARYSATKPQARFS